MSNDTKLTPENNARDIAALTSAVDMLVSQFIRPNTQQANANRKTLDTVINLLQRHAEGLLSLEQRLDKMLDGLESIRGIVAQNAQQIASTAQQQKANAQQISQNAEAISRYDAKLEETRQLVAKNSSDIAQLGVKFDQMIEENQAFRESQQTHLAAIIANGRRLDRLEQQAS
ncbi:MAG: hypothetical protein AAFQ63_15670 [Cyanobacteria bacterium J06621_11]